VLASATGANDRIVAVGNPLEPRGKFFGTHRPSSAWHALRIAATDHPNITGAGPFIPGGPTVEWLDRVRREEGDTSRFWVTRVAAEFPTTATDQLIPLDRIEAALVRGDDRAPGNILAQANQRPIIISVDPARFGSDSTCTLVLQGPVVRDIQTWNGADTVETTVRVAAIATAYGVRRDGPALPMGDPLARGWADGRIVCDAAVMGPGVIDPLRARGYEVEEFLDAARPPAETTTENAVRFENRRAWSYWQLREAFLRGTIAITPNPDARLLVEELAATRYETSGKDGVKIIRKKELRAALGRSPDRADALAMAWAATVDAVTIGGEVLTL
jgi:phage terminase large subunit